MRPFCIDAPVGPLVELTDLRRHLRVDSHEEDALIASYSQAAVDYLDGYGGVLGRCILPQKWALPLIGRPDVVMLPFPDCRDLQIERRSDETWTVIDGPALQFFEDQVSLSDMPEDWDNLFLTCQAGWASADHVPENLKQAVRLLVAHWYDNRSAAATGQVPQQVPLAVSAMIEPLKNIFV